MVYLILTIVGFIAPNVLVAIESFETGNILLYTNLVATMKGMFANQNSTIFIIDFLFAVLVFFIWTYFDGKKYGIKGVPWALTINNAFGTCWQISPLSLFKGKKQRPITKCPQWYNLFEYKPEIQLEHLADLTDLISRRCTKIMKARYFSFPDGHRFYFTDSSGNEWTA